MGNNTSFVFFSLLMSLNISKICSRHLNSLFCELTVHVYIFPIYLFKVLVFPISSLCPHTVQYKYFYLKYVLVYMHLCCKTVFL